MRAHARSHANNWQTSTHIDEMRAPAPVPLKISGIENPPHRAPWPGLAGWLAGGACVRQTRVRARFPIRCERERGHSRNWRATGVARAHSPWLVLDNTSWAGRLDSAAAISIDRCGGQHRRFGASPNCRTYWPPKWGRRDVDGDGVHGSGAVCGC